MTGKGHSERIKDRGIWIPAALAPLLVPVLLLLLWHLQNQGWPTDDGANFASTAFQIFDRFRTLGVFQGVAGLMDVRGWRPILFPTLLVPYLLALHGNIPLAVGGTLWTLYCGLVGYTYTFSRLFLPRSRAVIAAGVVVTAPVIMLFTTVFFSELSWVLFAVAWAYHLVRSDGFHRAGHGALAGTFLGLMLVTRPAESMAITLMPNVYFVVRAFRQGSLRWRDVWLASPVVVVSGGLLAASLSLRWLSRPTMWFITGTTVAICLPIALRNRGRWSMGHLAFWSCVCAIAVSWWAGFIGPLYDWIYTTSFGEMARVTAPPADSSILTVLHELLNWYGAFQLWSLAALAGIALVSFLLLRPSGTDVARIGQASCAKITELIVFVSGTLLPILVLYWLSRTGDPRRAMVGVAFLLLLLSVVALRARGRLAKPIAVLVCVVPIIQTWRLVPPCLGWPEPPQAVLRCCGPQLSAPLRTRDGNDVMADVLSRKVPRGSAVAVYTMALFSTPNRAYEPAALALALTSRHADVSIGYLWDQSAYGAVLERLTQQGYRFLVLDTWDDRQVRQSHMPYVHFAAALLDALRGGDSALPGLRRLESFADVGRPQVLFEIVAAGLAPNAPGDEAALWSQGDLAAARSGARALTTNHQRGFEETFLNDEGPMAWGSAESQEDTYAGVVLSEPQAIGLMRLVLFSPEGRAHLRDLSVVAADADGPPGPDWHIVRSRIHGERLFSEKVTMPRLPDNATVTIEIDPRDGSGGVHRLWGVACLSASRHDIRNYLPVGSGVYIRELQMKAAVAVSESRR